MGKDLIVGTGFAAALVKSYLNTKEIEVISPNFYAGYGQNEILHESRFLECNKPLNKRSSTISTLKHLPNKVVNLHNRIINGGNSSIWGGFYDATNAEDRLSFLSKIGAVPLDLSFDITGSASNNNNIKQLVDKYGHIYNAAINFKNNEILNSFLLKLIPKNGYILTEQLDLNSNKVLYKEYEKVYLCCGVYNTIGIINNSFNINNFNLGDYYHTLSICNLFSDMNESRGGVIIRYTIPRAINHYLGIQRQAKFTGQNLLIGVEQRFTNEKISLDLTIADGVLSSSTKAKEFGSSIHYSNLFIDGLPLNNFLESTCDGVVAFGMAAVMDYKPGPISNSIHDSIHKYFIGK
ncbi:hypothetical protein G6715_05035 [Polynucleobacter paneuropaeus]|nr:hypothetical protein [Polynucleobacter paneuropaeus]